MSTRIGCWIEIFGSTRRIALKASDAATISSTVQRWRWLAKEFDYRACWSFPVETRQGKLVGTFAMYYRQPTEPKQRDLELVSVLTRAAAKIISETLAE